MSIADVVPETRIKLNAEFRILFATLLSLCGVGLTLLVSASSAEGVRVYGDSLHFSKRQFIGMVAGVAAAWFISRVHVKVIRILAVLAYIATFGLLVYVLQAGRTVGGQRNWIPLIWGLNFQPSELAKLALIITCGAWVRFCVKFGFNLGVRMFGIMALTVVLAGLVLMEGDFGNMAILLAIGIAIAIVAGARWRWIFGSVLLVASGFAYLLVSGRLYRMERITDWLNPEADPLHGGYQLLHGQFALADGGWTGKGLGQSTEKWGALPAPHTDFILPIIAQELGVIGTGIVMFLLISLIVIAFQIADRSLDNYDRIAAFGVAAWLTVQTLVNVGGVTGLLPITGVPLPFISYGGTSVSFLLAATGILFGIARNHSTTESTV